MVEPSSLTTTYAVHVLVSSLLMVAVAPGGDCGRGAGALASAISASRRRARRASAALAHIARGIPPNLRGEMYRP